jgi:hypothetical protein
MAVVTVTRRGGLAGLGLRGACDASEFPDAEACLRAHVGQAAAPPTHPDSFVYDFNFDDNSLSMDESEVPDELRPLIDAALVNGEIV